MSLITNLFISNEKIRRRTKPAKLLTSVSKSMFVRMDIYKIYLRLAVLNEVGKILINPRVDNNLIKGNEFLKSL